TWMVHGEIMEATQACPGRSSRLSSEASSCRARRSEGNEPAVLLVPQVPADAAEAFPKRQALRIGELRVVAQDLGQTVERHAGLEVVDVVHPDVGGEPAQRARQDVVRAAV